VSGAARILWRTSLEGVKHAALPEFCGRPNPVLAGRWLFVALFSPGEAVALEARTGAVRWRRPLNGLGGSHVWPVGRNLYVKSSHTLFCLDAATGAERWRFCPYGEKNEWIYSGAEVSGTRLFIGDRKGWLHCLDARSGRRLWRKLTSRADNNDVNATPLVHGGTVHVATNDRWLIAYAERTGEELWRARLDGPCINRPLLALGGVVGHTADAIWLVDRRDGRVRKRWTFGSREIGGATPAGKGLAVLLRRPYARRSRLPDSTSARWLVIDAQGVAGPLRRAPPWTASVRSIPGRRLISLQHFRGVHLADWRSGDVLERIASRHMPTAIPEVRRGRLFTLDGEGTVTAWRLSSVTPGS